MSSGEVGVVEATWDGLKGRGQGSGETVGLSLRRGTVQVAKLAGRKAAVARVAGVRLLTDASMRRDMVATRDLGS